MKAAKLSLMFLACAAAIPAFAQSNSPMCGSTNLDRAQNVYTIKSPAASAVNQQCFIVVYPSGAVPAEAWQYPGSYFAEGTYAVELVGGGGGGGGGGSNDQGGGGGGAGAAPSRTEHYLAPGVYKMTIGTGGMGGAANGGWSGDGNPTSFTNVYTGQLVAGYPGADTWTQRYQGAGDGRGARAAAGGSSGGSGGDSGGRSEERAQAGGASQTPGFAGVAGQAGSETGRSIKTEAGKNVVQSNAGGGGGASIGSGGTGESATNSTVSQDGGRGGDGLIRLTMTRAAPVAMAPAPALQAIAAVPAASSASGGQAAPAREATRPAKKDRN